MRRRVPAEIRGEIFEGNTGEISGRISWRFPGRILLSGGISQKNSLGNSEKIPGRINGNSFGEIFWRVYCGISEVFPCGIPGGVLGGIIEGISSEIPVAIFEESLENY